MDRFLEIDSAAWSGLQETAAASPASNHVGAVRLFVPSAFQFALLIMSLVITICLIFFIVLEVAGRRRWCG